MDKTKDLMILQNQINNSIDNLVNTTISKNKIIVSNTTYKQVINDVKLDINELSSTASNLYTDGITKSELAENLLEHIKNNQDKYRLFSKFAKDILEEGWCKNIED